MPNISQNNEIEHINKKISLLQDRLEINKKRLTQFQNALTKIRRIRLKQGQRTNFLKPKRYIKYLRIYLNIRLAYQKKTDLLENALAHLKKERDYLKKD